MLWEKANYDMNPYPVEKKSERDIEHSFDSFIYVIIESQLNEQREEVDLVGTVPLTKLNTERI